MGKISKSIKYFIHAINYVRNLNTPIRFFNNKWYVNERIVELPFTHHVLDLDTLADQEILELGCTRSTLSLELCSLGAKVTGVDLRPFFAKHPNFTFHQKNVLELDEKKKYDTVLSISTVEHIGLGAYGEEENLKDLHAVTKKIDKLLNPGGTIVFTVPFGEKSQNSFFRSFSYDQIKDLFNEKKIKLTKEYYYVSDEEKFWRPTTRDEAAKVSNALEDLGPSGVNCVGCFVWVKK